MRTTLFAGASALLLASTAATAQMQTPPSTPDMSAPTDSGTAGTDPMPTQAPPSPPMNPPVGEQTMPGQSTPPTVPPSGDPSASPGQSGTMGTVPSGNGTMGTMGSGSMGQGSMSAPGAMTPPPTPRESYPMCSRTVTDNCRQAGDGSSSKRKMRRR